MSNLPDAYDLAHPDFDDKNLSELARVAVEFEYQPCFRDSEKLLEGDPPSRVYWTVRLGRMALRRDGEWAYHCRAAHCEKKEDRRFVQMQRFVDFEEAVRVATKVFGKEPEHAIWMRETAKHFSEEKKS